MKKLPLGLYDLLHTKKLHKHLKKNGVLELAVWRKIDSEEMYYRMGQLLSKEIVLYLKNKFLLKKQRNYLVI